jgi:hypothetical protein
LQESELLPSYWERAAERIFNLDPAVRYVGIADLDYHVILSKMRPGLSSLTPTDVDWNFLSMVPKSIVDSAQKLENDCGPLRIVNIRYRKVMVTIYRGTRHIVMLSFEPTVETPFLSKLAASLESIVR